MSQVHKKMRELNQKVAKLWAPLVMFFIIFYSYYQMFNSERGVIVWYDLKNQVNMLMRENAALNLQVEQTEESLSRLKPENLDPDFIDEQIRRNLPKMHVNEIVIFLK